MVLSRKLMTATPRKNLIKIKQIIPGSRGKASLLSAASLLAFVGLILTMASPGVSAASCVPPATTYGTDTLSVQQPTTSTYTIWVRLQTPSATTTSPLMLQTSTGSAATNPSCFNVGATTSIPANTWTWVNAGSTALTAYTASAANQTEAKLIGIQAGLEVDSVLFLANANCTPTGTGTNCTTGQPAPTAPSLTATAASSTTVALKWTQSTDSSGLNVAGYYVFRGTTKVATITNASTLTYTDTVTAGSTNTYTVEAYDNSSPVVTSTASNAVSVSTGLTAPSSLSATAASATQVNLAWKASTDGGGPGVASYNILRSGDNIASVSGTTTSFSDKTALAGTTYSYTIEATDSSTPPATATSTAVSVTTPKVATVVPSAPTNVKATAPTDKSVSLTWTASTDASTSAKVAGYYIIRAVSGGSSGTTIAQVASPTVTYTDTTVAPSTSYSYTIEAFDSSATPVVSPASTAASVTTPAAPVTTQPPAAPTGLAATAISTSQINLAWTASSGATSYIIYRSTGTTTSGATSIGTVSTTTYGNTGLSADMAYSYYVIAANASTTKSSASNTATATTQKTVVTPPPTTATVEGTVTNATTKAALADVSIHTGVHGTAAGAASADTNSAGQYVLSGITTTGSHSYTYIDSGYSTLRFSKAFPAGINTVNEALTPTTSHKHHHRG
jgi:hypothetical protein